MTEGDNKLTPGTFAPADAPDAREELAATAFEPLSQASQKEARVSAAQIAIGSSGLVLTALLFFLLTARSLTCLLYTSPSPRD